MLKYNINLSVIFIRYYKFDLVLFYNILLFIGRSRKSSLRYIFYVQLLIDKDVHSNFATTFDNLTVYPLIFLFSNENYLGILI